jgi:hypothetical protein
LQQFCTVVIVAVADVTVAIWCAENITDLGAPKTSDAESDVAIWCSSVEIQAWQQLDQMTFIALFDSMCLQS